MILGFDPKISTLSKEGGKSRDSQDPVSMRPLNANARDSVSCLHFRLAVVSLVPVDSIDSSRR